MIGIDEEPTKDVIEMYKRNEIILLLEKYVPVFTEVAKDLEKARCVARDFRLCLLGSKVDVMSDADNNPTYNELKQLYYAVRKKKYDMEKEHFKKYPVIIKDVDYEMMSELKEAGIDDEEAEVILKPYGVKI